MSKNKITTTTTEGKQTGGRSLVAAMASKFQMEPKQFLDTIRKTVMPDARSNEELAAFLMVAQRYDLNPVAGEIHAFPKKGGGIQAVLGVDGWINLIHRQADLDGIEFEFTDDDRGRPVSCTCRIYRKSMERPIAVTEYMDEVRRDTAPWRSHPRRMLRHKALIQAARIAFGLGAGIVDPDEAEAIREAAEIAPDPLAEKRSEIIDKIDTKRPKKRGRKKDPEPAPAPGPQDEPDAAPEETVIETDTDPQDAELQDAIGLHPTDDDIPA